MEQGLLRRRRYCAQYNCYSIMTCRMCLHAGQVYGSILSWGILPTSAYGHSAVGERGQVPSSCQPQSGSNHRGQWEDPLFHQASAGKLRAWCDIWWTWTFYSTQRVVGGVLDGSAKEWSLKEAQLMVTSIELLTGTLELGSQEVSEHSLFSTIPTLSPLSLVWEILFLLL